MSPDKESGGPRIWTGNDGVARSSYEVTARRVIFLGGRGASSGGGASSEPEPSFPEDDIPF